MSSFSVEEFEKEYHKQKKPVIIKGKRLLIKNAPKIGKLVNGLMNA